MPISIEPTIELENLTLTKLRELSPDSINYTRIGHSVQLPITVTVSSDLPSPTKGNAGTVKTTINSRVNVMLAEGTPNEKRVPVICKVQTSFPVGTTLADRRKAVNGAVAALLQDDEAFDKLFYHGLLPND
jgi:hypothetical protein